MGAGGSVGGEREGKWEVRGAGGSVGGEREGISGMGG